MLSYYSAGKYEMINEIQCNGCMGKDMELAGFAPT